MAKKRDFDALVSDISRLSARCDKATAALQTAKGELHTALESLEDLCRPHCLTACTQYNKTAHYRIVIDSILLGFDIERHTLSMSVHLETRLGREPDEDLGFEDTGKIADEIASILNPLLATAKIPLKLSRLSVPTGYFMK